MIQSSVKPARLHDQLAELKEEALARLVERLRHEFLVAPVMAVEIEFYLSGSRIGTYPKAVLAVIDRALERADIPAHPAEEERGQSQFEVALRPDRNLARLARHVQEAPVVIRNALTAEDIETNFSPKPFAADFGNGMHWHLHLENRKGENVFSRSEAGQYSRDLLWALGGLLQTMPESLLLFIPNAASHTRLQAPKMNAPTTLSWGPNNRTVALRLPSKPLDAKHIEHRIAGMDADPWLCILGILAGVTHGLTQKLYPGEATYGDASDPQYDLDAFPEHEDAVRYFGKSEIMPEYLGEELCEGVMRQAVYPDAF